MKLIFKLRLSCIALSLVIVFSFYYVYPTSFNEMNLFLYVFPSISFYLFFDHLFSVLGVYDRIVKQEVEQYFEKNKENFIKENKQNERKKAFQQALLSEDDIDVQNEAQLKTKNKQVKFEQAKISFTGKSVSDMDEMEKAQYYLQKYEKLRPFTYISVSLSLLVFSISTLIATTDNTLYLLTMIFIILLVSFIATAICLLNMRHFNKYKYYLNNIFKDEFSKFDKLLEDLK